LRLSKRMKKVILLLLREGLLNRDQIISYFEGNVRTRGSKIFPSEMIPSTDARVTFDRTFKILKALGLIEAKHEQPYRSQYLGTFLHGYSYQLTENGILFGTKLKETIRADIEEHWDLVKGKKESTPKPRRLHFYCSHCGCWLSGPEESENKESLA
jgi:hypothetical protein